MKKTMKINVENGVVHGVWEVIINKFVEKTEAFDLRVNELRVF